jgi:hypothetical protein
MTKILSVIFLIIFLIIMTGCAVGVKREVIKQEPFQGDEKLTYLIPKDEGVENTGFFLKGLVMKSTKSYYQKYPGSNIYFVRGIDIESDPQRSLIICSEYDGERFGATYRGEKDTEYSSYVRYYVQVNVEDKEDKYVVSLIPINKEVVRGCGPLCTSHYDIPDFTEKKLIKFLSETSIGFKVEIDSPYNTESTYSNFKRLLREEALGQPYSDPVTGKIYKSAFYLPKDNKRVKLFVDVYPYRNGSKAVISVELTVSVDPDTKVSDIGKDILNVKAELERIVKS